MQRLTNINFKNKGRCIGELTNSQRNVEKQMADITDSDEVSTH